jgi:hypothetical protein
LLFFRQPSFGANPGDDICIGSRDERLFHLMSLAAIAQIGQEDDFESRWMVSRGA